MKPTIYSVVTLRRLIRQYKRKGQGLRPIYGGYDFRGKAFRELNMIALECYLKQPFGLVNP